MGGFFQTICDYIVPKQCIGCGAMDTWICIDCIRKHLAIRSMQLDERGIHTYGVQSITTIGAYGNPFWRTAITQLKFQHAVEIAPVLSLLLRETVLHYTTMVRGAACKHSPVCVLPLPTHQKRIRERGYNQTELLSQSLHLPPYCVLYPHALQKRSYTHSQTQVDYATRLTNIAGTIDVDRTMIQVLQASTIILVDDVITTGATIREAAQALACVHPKEVHALAVARG